MESNYKKVLREIKELLVKQNESLEQLTQLFLDKWKSEDERYGEYRWPYDEEGDLLSGVNHTGLYPWHNEEPHEEEG